MSLSLKILSRSANLLLAMLQVSLRMRMYMIVPVLAPTTLMATLRLLPILVTDQWMSILIPSASIAMKGLSFQGGTQNLAARIKAPLLLTAHLEASQMWVEILMMSISCLTSTLLFLARARLPLPPKRLNLSRKSDLDRRMSQVT